MNQSFDIRANIQKISRFWSFLPLLGLLGPLAGPIRGPKPSLLFKFCSSTRDNSLRTDDLAFHFHRAKKMIIQNAMVWVISCYFLFIGAPGWTPSGAHKLHFLYPTIRWQYLNIKSTSPITSKAKLQQKTHFSDDLGFFFLFKGHLGAPGGTPGSTVLFFFIILHLITTNPSNRTNPELIY